MDSALAGVILQESNPNFEFEILDVLGKGGFGSVYLARSLVSGKLVATKQINIEQHEADLESCRLEIQILNDCCHPNVVQYLGSYVFDDVLWINLEFCEGGSVADVMKAMKMPLKEEQISVICREALKGLAYLHQLKIVHRDIKSGNIMINAEGEVKLADFGVSAQLTESINKKNTFVGTPFWMSPEVIMQTQHDGKADIWSLGITAIEMAEMVPPHSTVHPMRLLFLVPKEDAPKLQDQSQSRWTSDFHSFIETCLVKDPLRRPSALELLKHPFVNNSLSVADVLLPLVRHVISMKSAKSSCSEQFDSVLMPNGIPERVEPLPGHSSAVMPYEAAAKSEEPDDAYASVIYRKPAPHAAEVAAPAVAQSAHAEVHIDFLSREHTMCPQDKASSCNTDSERAAAVESTGSDLGEFEAILEICSDCFPCLNISSNLHEHLLLASSLEIEKSLFEKHLAHRNSIKDVGPILGNFLLAAETEVADGNGSQHFDDFLSIVARHKRI